MLPITSYKDEIIETIRNHSFTIIVAETGSGKSTQVPQYLMKYFKQVIVTEPRIMAAKTLARRVSEEMGVVLGEEVGYKTAYDKCASENSKILYCTDGLQLIKSIFNQDLESENVLIIDEVHEWNLNIETLIAWTKLMQDKWNTKVVIMSATLESENLAEYLGEDVAMYKVPGKTYNVSIEERNSTDLIDTIKENIDKKRNILVFVAGKKEISEVIEDLDGTDATVLPLHGEMDWEEQKLCFDSYSNSKVIVATNVAQTSLTIPDIDVVVDTGIAKIPFAENGVKGIFLKAISKADIKQRAGRAGRTKDGKYILCSNTLIKYRDDYTVPEIQRSILDQVVLQLLAIDLDAEELEFYHQPERIAIINAKKELVTIGALDSNNKITELGRKITKIPVSVQTARMIIEAEKYSVTEPVITIAAIMEWGGLLRRGNNYRNFTTERESDLLAELDVWNQINNMKYIDFNTLQIKKATYLKIKAHLKKIKDALYGIVEITNNNDREAILKSCLSGLVSRIYINDGDDIFYGDDWTQYRLDRNSCISGRINKVIIGRPKTIEFKDSWGYKRHLNLISFASSISVKMIEELFPVAVKKTVEHEYSSVKDAIKVVTKIFFKDELIGIETYFDYDHPLYDELKNQYEEKKKIYQRTISFYEEQQRELIIEGKTFYVNYWKGRPVVTLDLETLFTTKEKEVYLDNGDRVKFTTNITSREEVNIPALKCAVDNLLIMRKKEIKRDEYSMIKVSTLKDVLSNSSKLGKIVLTMNNGGYGDEEIVTYGCISLKRNTVVFTTMDDEEIANASTIEALQNLFIKEVEKKYGEGNFSHLPGKKKKVLTEEEKKMKMDFDSLVREILLSLTIENAVENLEFLEEYYQDLMKA